MTSDIAHRQRRIRRKFLLNPQRPGNQRRRLHIRLNAPRNQQRPRRKRSRRIDWKLRNGQRLDAVRRIERSVLIGSIPERILQIVVHSKARANYGLVVDGTPRQSDARLRKKLGIVGGEQRVADVRLAGNHSIAERVIRGASVRLIPTGRELIAEAERHRQIWRYADDVLARTRHRKAIANSSPWAPDRKEKWTSFPAETSAGW